MLGGVMCWAAGTAQGTVTRASHCKYVAPRTCGPCQPSENLQNLRERCLDSCRKAFAMSNLAFQELVKLENHQKYIGNTGSSGQLLQSHDDPFPMCSSCVHTTRFEMGLGLRGWSSWMWVHSSIFCPPGVWNKNKNSKVIVSAHLSLSYFPSLLR